RRLTAGLLAAEVVVAPPATENLEAAKWRLAFDLTVQAGDMESRLHAVERVPPKGRGKPPQFIPVRFVFSNRLVKDDRLLMAFDALLLSEALGREVPIGKIVHGDNHATSQVKIPGLLKITRKLINHLTVLLNHSSPPDLVLNRH